MKQTSIRLRPELVNNKIPISTQINNALEFVNFTKQILEEDSISEMKIQKIQVLYEALIKKGEI